MFLTEIISGVGCWFLYSHKNKEREQWSDGLNNININLIHGYLNTYTIQKLLTKLLPVLDSRHLWRTGPSLHTIRDTSKYNIFPKQAESIIFCQSLILGKKNWREFFYRTIIYRTQKQNQHKYPWLTQKNSISVINTHKISILVIFRREYTPPLNYYQELVSHPRYLVPWGDMSLLKKTPACVPPSQLQQHVFTIALLEAEKAAHMQGSF